MQRPDDANRQVGSEAVVAVGGEDDGGDALGGRGLGRELVIQRVERAAPCLRQKRTGVFQRVVLPHVAEADVDEAQGLGQDCVLAVPAAEERDAGDGQDADQHGQRGDLHLRIQAAHLGHVLLVVTAVDDAAGAEEQ